MTVSAPSRLAWAELVALEPRLAELLDEVKALRLRGSSVLAAWYGFNGWPGFKPRVTNLVGWYRGDDDDPAVAAWRHEVSAMMASNGGAVDLANVPDLPERSIGRDEDPRLFSHEAYEVAYETLLSALRDRSD